MTFNDAKIESKKRSFAESNRFYVICPGISKNRHKILTQYEIDRDYIHEPILFTADEGAFIASEMKRLIHKLQRSTMADDTTADETTLTDYLAKTNRAFRWENFQVRIYNKDAK